MLSLPSSVRVYMAQKPLDMRTSFDGMLTQVVGTLKKNPQSGHLFVFCNRRGDKVRILHWDRNGYAFWYKRLERGRFRLPKVGASVCRVSGQELMLLLEGIDLTQKRHYRMG